MSFMGAFRFFVPVQQALQRRKHDAKCAGKAIARFQGLTAPAERVGPKKRTHLEAESDY
jgi:hypothetical protein